MKNSRNADSTVTIEEYMLDLSEKYQTRFTALVEKLESTLPHNRNYLLEEELNRIGMESISECADIDLLKYMANKVIFDSLGRRLFANMGKRSYPQKEIVVDGYKTDIYLPGADTIIEVKSIISLDKQAIFPIVYSERAINKLKKIRELLQGGKKVTYLFVSLNPYVESFAISNEKQMDEFRGLFLDCLEWGMECKGYTTCLNNYEIQIKKEIPFIISNS